MNEHQYPASLTHGLSRKEILNRLRNRLDQPRYEHCLRVEATAIELAKRFDQDVDRAGLAGLLHDYGKEISVETYKRVIIEDGFDPSYCSMAVVCGMALSGFILFKPKSALPINKC